MADHLHTVTITHRDGETLPRIEFRCAGDRTAECHRYPDCGCESWGSDEDEHPHPFVEHGECWMQGWFDNDGIDPSTDLLAECDITPGMSGPIKAWFEGEYVEWEFIVPEVIDRRVDRPFLAEQARPQHSERIQQLLRRSRSAVEGTETEGGRDE